jgi:3',5'-cyclic AMP phosphodiesterase CpdA
VAANVVQISDPHVGARWARADPLQTLSGVIEAIGALPFSADGVIVTGDLAADGTDEQYAALVEVLGSLEVPWAALPGNHDDRAALRRHIDVGASGPADAPTSHVRRFGELRVVMLDTIVPGSDGGDLDGGRLEWLARQLDADSGDAPPTLIAMHHPPFPCGVPEMDRIRLAPGAAHGLAELIGSHPEIVGLTCGHNHRVIAASFAGRPALVAPSTYCQFPLDLAGLGVAPVPDPVGFAVHSLLPRLDGEPARRLVSHVQPLALTAA